MCLFFSYFFFFGKIEIAFQFSCICTFFLHPFVFRVLFSGLRACSICKCNGSEIEIQPACGSLYLSLFRPPRPVSVSFCNGSISLQPCKVFGFNFVAICCNLLLLKSAIGFVRLAHNFQAKSKVWNSRSPI